MSNLFIEGMGKARLGGSVACLACHSNLSEAAESTANLVLVPVHTMLPTSEEASFIFGFVFQPYGLHRPTIKVKKKKKICSFLSLSLLKYILQLSAFRD